MTRDQDIYSHSFLLRCRLATNEFKICPLCESVNVRQNSECFCCKWTGKFVEDPHVIETSLYHMISHCPELLAILVSDMEEPKPTFKERLAHLVSRLLRRVDVRA